MGAGGEAERRWSTRSRHTTTEAPAESHHMKTRSRRGVGTLGRRSRQTSYDKLHELADWKMIGLHDKYADATMVRIGV
ncbi:hypothetical protein N9L76_05380 [bacterium]|nr:hypothetical protein [bacterium]